MSKSINRLAADNIDNLSMLDQDVQAIAAALIQQGVAGNFTPMFTTITIQLLPVGTAPSASVTGADYKNLTLTLKLPAAQKGDMGSTPVFNGVVQVTTLAAGAAATASIDNTNPLQPVLRLGLPKGDTGNATANAVLAALGNLNPQADQIAYFTSGTAAALAAFTSFARTLASKTDAAGVRTALALGTPSTWSEATDAQIRNATASVLISAAAYWAALVPAVLTDAASIAFDLSTGINFRVTLGGNRTLSAPTNAKPGQEGFIYVVQDGTGGRTLSFNASYKFSDVVTAPSLNAAANAGTMLRYHVSATGVFYITGGKPSTGGLRAQTLSSLYDPNTGSVSFDFIGPIVNASTWTYRVGPANGGGALPTIERSNGANTGNFDGQIAAAAPANSTGSFALDAGASIRVRVGNGNPGSTFVDFVQTS